ncbi:MAG: hypothetical protein MJZ87_07910 [Bacteroidales bacterium]|nr:hypothetical protein [Bacteroidales bacterium]
MGILTVDREPQSDSQKNASRDRVPYPHKGLPQFTVTVFVFNPPTMVPPSTIQ